MIYFIQSSSEGKPIKIGFSQCPEQRLRALQTSSAYKLYLLGAMQGDRELERKIHDKFQSNRINGEWFQPTDELIHFIIEVNRMTIINQMIHDEEAKIGLALYIKAHLPDIQFSEIREITDVTLNIILDAIRATLTHSTTSLLDTIYPAREEAAKDNRPTPLGVGPGGRADTGAHWAKRQGQAE